MMNDNTLPKKLEKLGFKRMSVFETTHMAGFAGAYKRELKRPRCTDYWIPEFPDSITRKFPSEGYGCSGIYITRAI
jgi:hypothetical protein